MDFFKYWKNSRLNLNTTNHCNIFKIASSIFCAIRKITLVWYFYAESIEIFFFHTQHKSKHKLCFINFQTIKYIHLFLRYSWNMKHYETFIVFVLGMIERKKKTLIICTLILRFFLVYVFVFVKYLKIT